jgi:hypothetical protein
MSLHHWISAVAETRQRELPRTVTSSGSAARRAIGRGFAAADGALLSARLARRAAGKARVVGRRLSDAGRAGHGAS